MEWSSNGWLCCYIVQCHVQMKVVGKQCTLSITRYVQSAGTPITSSPLPPAAPSTSHLVSTPHSRSNVTGELSTFRPHYICLRRLISLSLVPLERLLPAMTDSSTNAIGGGSGTSEEQKTFITQGSIHAPLQPQSTSPIMCAVTLDRSLAD
jgi:hypothetical protein